MHVSRLYPNYFSSRLQVALQHPTAKGYANLLGSMREDVEPELQARAELAKWNPIRHHSKDFSKRGRAFSGTTLRVCARLFARDLYQFAISSNAEVEPSEVAFALTLQSSPEAGSTSSIYDSVRSRLGNYVEAAVNELEVPITTGGPTAGT